MEESGLILGLVVTALGVLAWAATLSFGWIAPASVVGRMDRTIIGLSTVCMLVTVFGVGSAVIALT